VGAVRELGLELVDGKSTTMKTTDELKKSSIDYYAALRSAYRQYRAKEIRNGAALPPSALPNMDDEGDPFALNPTRAGNKTGRIALYTGADRFSLPRGLNASPYIACVIHIGHRP